MADNYNAFPKLTSATPNPRSKVTPDDEHFSNADEPVSRQVLPYAYEDMRGNHWLCVWMGQAWIAKPAPDAIAAYGLTDPNNRDEGASDARGLVEQIESKLEARRIAARDNERSGSWFWLLVIIGGVYYYDKGKGRRGRRR